MKIDPKTLKIGDQFLIKNGMTHRMGQAIKAPKKPKKGELWIEGTEVAIYMGELLKGQYDFETCINGQPCGHLTQSAADLETNVFQLEPIDNTHSAYIKGVNVEGMNALNDLFKEMGDAEEKGEDPMKAIGKMLKKKGLPFP